MPEARQPAGENVRTPVALNVYDVQVVDVEVPSVTLLICAIAGLSAIAAMHAPASWSKRL